MRIPVGDERIDSDGEVHRLLQCVPHRVKVHAQPKRVHWKIVCLAAGCCLLEEHDLLVVVLVLFHVRKVFRLCWLDSE